MPIQTRSGFTLVELLVVIAIISILATISVVIFRGVSAGARDAERKADIGAIAKAYEVGYQTGGSYQTLIPANFAGGTIPTPPESGNYYNVLANDYSGFKTCAVLEGNPNQYCNSTSATCYCKLSTQGNVVNTGQIIGPGATEIGWDPGPTSIANLKLWLAADNITGLSDGNSVATWNDFSGFANHANSAGAGGQPIYRTNIINGKPTVRFANLQYVRVNSFSSQFTTAASWFVVFNPQGDTLYSLFYTGGDHYERYGNAHSYPAAFKATSRYNDYFLSVPTAGSHMISGISDTNYQMFLDGVAGTLLTGHVFGLQQTTLDIGGNAPNAGSISGDIAEVIVYSRALPVGERQTVESYLRTKYNLP